MKQLLLSIFTWWNSATFSTMFWTRLHGEEVGRDEFGNIYYQTKGGKIDKALGFQRRWVIYNGLMEASTIPPGWNGWLHHTVDVPPSQETYVAKPWQLPHTARKVRWPRGASVRLRPAIISLGRPIPDETLALFDDYGALGRICGASRRVQGGLYGQCRIVSGGNNLHLSGTTGRINIECL